MQAITQKEHVEDDFYEGTEFDEPEVKPWFDPVTELDDDDDFQHVMLALGNSSEPGDGKPIRIGNLTCGHVGHEGNIQVKLGTAPKINYIRECTGTS